MNRELKRYERGAEKGRYLENGQVLLAGYTVKLGESELLFSQENYTAEDFGEQFEVKTGEWLVEGGWIVGKNPDMCPGMIVSRADYFGDVMVEITAKMVAPATHDINVMINGEWDEEKDCRGNAYVAGLEAFWHGNVGFEKSPEYKLTAATALFDFDPEKEYRFRFGNIQGKIFVLVDDRLCLEVTDPEPLDSSRYGKIGFEAYSSWWKFKNLKVYRISSEAVTEYYNPEFQETKQAEELNYGM